ncbi:winged helix-turn-helix transcriptional regulator [Ligilactobacillus agilis]|uniref:winged helix-turn-helix transcriptional regulator n=1 Tax=Ligilactobacillus agilis TaxID=1601 RepID=UPI003F891C9E
MKRIENFYALFCFQVSVIRNLMKKNWRFNELQRSLDGISQKVLTDSLRQLCEDGIIFRKDYQTKPPKVEYGMTDLGKELLQVLKEMEKFGEYYKSL